MSFLQQNLTGTLSFDWLSGKNEFYCLLHATTSLRQHRYIKEDNLKKKQFHPFNSIFICKLLR